jgi:glycosyltransferase involved in cell wall biosynthesis
MVDKVIFRSIWAAERAREHYGLEERKVAVVLPGANFSADALLAFDQSHQSPNRAGPCLKLIFVGKDWKRKGLDRLLGAVRLAREGGANVSLTVVGVSSDQVPSAFHTGLPINWLGFVDKARGVNYFLDLLAQHDIGVLLSRSEAGGISLREFGRVGLPVIAPDTGGSPEFAMSDSAFLISPQATDSSIAEIICHLAADRKNLHNLKQEAHARRRLFDWETSVRLLEQNCI